MPIFVSTVKSSLLELHFHLLLRNVIVFFYVPGTSLRSLLQTDNIILPLLCTVMAISVIVIAFLIHAIKKKKCDYCNKEGNRSYLTKVTSLNLCNFIYFYLSILFCSCCFTAWKCCKKEFKGKINLSKKLWCILTGICQIICDTFPQGDEDAWIYSAAVFTVMKTGSDGMSDAKAVDRRRIYAAVKAFGLD